MTHHHPSLLFQANVKQWFNEGCTFIYLYVIYVAFVKCGLVLVLYLLMG